MKLCSLQWCPEPGREALGTNWSPRGSPWLSEAFFFAVLMLEPCTGTREAVGSCSWRSPKAPHALGTSSGCLLEQGELDHLSSRSSFQPQTFSDSVILTLPFPLPLCTLLYLQMLKISPKFTASFCPCAAIFQGAFCTNQTTTSYLKLYHSD